MFVTAIRRTAVAGSICCWLFSIARQADAESNPLAQRRDGKAVSSEFIRLTVRAKDDPSSLNQLRLEDLKEYDRLSTLAKQIKPFCPSMLADELSLPEVPVISRLPPGLKTLWLQAAGQPEAELQLQAAEAFERASHFDGEDLTDVPPFLVKILDAANTERAVRLAAARSLIMLNARESAPILKRHAATGLEFAQLVEPVLADWNDESMSSVWQARLQDGNASLPLTLWPAPEAPTGGK